MLPFSGHRRSEPVVEAAAVFTVAEAQRNRSGGLFGRQSPEALAFIAKLGYPLWLFPMNNSALIFDGLGSATHNVSYVESTSAKTFLDCLEANELPREKYLTFLSDHGSYFDHPPQTKQYPMNGLIWDTDFKEDFSVYRKEATELTEPAALLIPLLEESVVASQIADLEKLQTKLHTEKEKLVTCLRSIKRITGQYITEIDFDAAAATEEITAKIKAQEELVNPQIAKLNKEYQHKIKDLTTSFDSELESLQKQKTKTDRSIDTTENKIKEYEHGAKLQGKQGHKIYETRWKAKVKTARKELSGLKKELKRIECRIKKVDKQRSNEIANLNFEWDAGIKLRRQPLLDLEAQQKQKAAAFRTESNRLQAMEKPVADGLARCIELRQTVNYDFDNLGIGNPQLKGPSLIYVPFYAVCYEAGLARRYLCIAPSAVNSVDFSTKLKQAFGFNKIGNLLTPRSKPIATLITKVETVANQNSSLESQLWSLSEKNDLLKNRTFCTDVEHGLVFLKHHGWLSERETTDLLDTLGHSG